MTCPHCKRLSIREHCSRCTWSECAKCLSKWDSTKPDHICGKGECQAAKGKRR